MNDSIKTEDVAFTWKKLHEAKRNLKQKNIRNSLIALKEALQKRIAAPMLAADQREIDKDIHSFQPILFGSKAFTDIFGPVSFQDNDPETLLEFVLQLIRAQEHDFTEVVQTTPEHRANDDSKNNDLEISGQAQVIMELLESGDLSTAKQLLHGDEKLCVYVANSYNDFGITNRKDGRFEQSIDHYMKALVALPEDEGIYYNIARCRYEQGSLEQAVTAIKMALKINPDFPEGNDLLRFLVQSKGNKKKRFGFRGKNV